MASKSGRALWTSIERGIEERRFNINRALKLLGEMTLQQLVYFKERSHIVREALREHNWWYFLFARRYPLTAERLSSMRIMTWLLRRVRVSIDGI